MPTVPLSDEEGHGTAEYIMKSLSYNRSIYIISSLGFLVDGKLDIRPSDLDG